MCSGMELITLGGQSAGVPAAVEGVQVPAAAPKPLQRVTPQKAQARGPGLRPGNSISRLHPSFAMEKQLRDFRVK